jgi:hypothetical protein
MNPDTGEYRRLLEGELLRENEVLVLGTDDQIATLSRNVRRGLRKTDPSTPLEDRVAKLEAAEADRQRQTQLRGRAQAVGLVLPKGGDG